MKAKLINKALAWLMTLTMVVSMLPVSVFAAGGNVAKVGNTEYATIDEAVAAWTNGTTLTLLSDVTLSDVVTLKSTEHHILNLGTYTMTAASGKNAFVIQACGNGSAERSVITINADATNPGGINAGSKCIVYYKYADGGISTEDRPIIRINGGVFTGATSAWGTAGIYTIGTAARKCATVNITGGTFNCSINGSGKSKLIISGGTFNYSVGSQGDSTASRLISGGTFKSFGFMTADSNNTKFWIGTSMGNSNVGAYVDDNGYLVVGGPVVTEAGETFEASSANYGGFSSYLQYSSAKDNGLYYTSVEEAFADNNKNTGSVTVYVDELDMTNINYKGTIVVPEGETVTITIAEGTTPAWTVSGAENAVTYVNEEGVALEKSEDGSFTAPVVNNSGVVIADTLTGVVVDEIKASTALQGYEPVNVPAGAELVIELTEADTAERIVYEVAPMQDGNKVQPGANEPVTFRLPVPASVSDAWAKVYHEAEYMGLYDIVGEGSDKHVVVSSDSFSAFTVEPTTPVKIGETGYATLADALTAAAAMTGDVTVEIYDKVTLKSNLSGSYDSIKFVGKDADAEIYLEVEGYITATSKTVAFEKLILSKSKGDYINNAGFMNVAFGVYDVSEVTYTDCTFANGAYASSGKVTFTGCTFYRSYDKYGLWAYGDVDVTVDSCTFDDYRGIKMYAEGAAKTVDLTVKGTDFSALTGKPAIVLTYGESVTLEGNIYSATGTFELENSGSSNGTTIVVAEGENIVCKTEVNNAMVDCGVLVDGKIYDTVANAAKVATSGSTVTLLHNTTETVELAEGVNLDKNGYTADGVTVKTAAPTSTLTNCYTSDSGYWGECGGNASESFVFKFYNGNTYMGCTSLNNVDGIIDGDVYVSWSIKLDAESNTDPYWTMAWEIQPTLDMQPTRVEHWVDGVKAGEATVEPNWSDRIRPVVAAVTDEDGKILSYVNGTEGHTLADAVKAGGYITLLADVKLSDTLIIDTNEVAIDGDGHKITLASSFANTNAWGAAIMVGNSGYSDADVANHKVTIENVVFDGITGNSLIRAQGVELVMDGCTVQNCDSTNTDQGMLRIDTTEATIQNCIFTDNKATKIIGHNHNTSGSAIGMTIDNCVFSANTISGPGVVVLSSDAGCAITDNKFVGNDVTCDNGATVYMGFTENNAVTGNLFKDNTVTGNASSNRIAGALFVGYTNEISGNAFVGNTATNASEGGIAANSVCVDTYYNAEIDLSENYWGGNEPDAVAIGGHADVYVYDSYYTELNEDGTIDESSKVEIKPSVIIVNSTEEAQAALDAAVDGTTIQLAENVEYGVLYVGRPTKSNDTTMYCQTHDFTTTEVEAFEAHLADGQYHTTPHYTTNLKNATIVGAEGATVAGLVATSGHMYGVVKDYVLDKEYTSGSAYYSTLNIENLKFSGVNFTGKVNINTSDATSVYNGVTFESCTFTTGGTASANGAAVRYYNESNNGNVKNIVVDDCTFTSCYQGVYTHHVNGVTVTDSEFNTTGHNAIALQGHDGAVNFGTVVISGNTFENIQDRVIRVNEAGADSEIVIKDNSIIDSGDAEGEFIKVTSIADGGTITRSGNTWNGYADDELVYENGVLCKPVEAGLEGEGTAEDPFLVADIDDLTFFRNSVNGGESYKGQYVKLTADIDLKSEAWTPIGNSTNKFQGTFDGDNHTISNLVINGGSSSNMGLFGMTTNGEIKNLTVNNAKVSGRLNVGVIAGTPYTSKFTNIKVAGHVEVNGMSYVGGVGGKNAYANWTDITVDVDETSYVKAVSTEYDPDSDYADSEGYVSYRTYVGGVIGFNGEGSHTFTNISSNIKVIGDVCDIGGIFGIAHYGNNFENITCSGAVTSTGEADEIGGIAGVWYNQLGQTVTMNNVSFTGTVSDKNGTVEGVDIVGGAYNASNDTAENSGSLMIDGKEAWLKTYVAQIGEVKYTSIDAALTAAVSGDTITLLADAAMENTYSVADMVLNIDGDYTLTINDADDNSLLKVSDESTLNISSAISGEVWLDDGVVLKDSTINGSVFVGGKVIFCGDNTVGMIYDYGTLTDYYGTAANMEWTVEEGSTLTITNKARYGLGYGDKITIYGSLTDALTARETLTDDDLSFFSHGIVAQESKGWNCNSFMTVKDAYVVIGDNNSFGNKPGNYGGTYTYDFENVVLNSSRITFCEALSTTTFNFTNSDVQVNSAFMTRDADSAFNLTNTKLVVLASAPGNDERSMNAGTLNLVNSILQINKRVEDTEFVYDNTGSITADAASRLVFDVLNSTGTIVIDAADITADEVKVIEQTNAAATSLEGVVTVNNLPAGYSVSYEDGDVTILKAKQPSGEIAYRAYITDSTSRESISVDLVDVYAKESFVVELYDANGNLLTTTTLKRGGVEAASYSANIVLWGATSSSWDTVIHAEKLTVANIPATIKVWADNVLTDTYVNARGAGTGVDETAEYMALDCVYKEAQIGETYYATLADAVAAAEAGDTVTLLAPIVVAAGESLTLNKAVTIAYTSNVPGEDMITNRGTLVIDGATLVYTNTDTTGSNVTVSTISCEPGSVLTVNSGVVKNDSANNSMSGAGSFAYAIDLVTNGGLGDVTATINGGEVISTNYMAIRQFVNGETCKNTLTVNDGTIQGATRGINIQLKNNMAYTTINGGTIEGGDYALCFLTTSENLSVTGGEFKGDVWYSGTNGFVTGGTFATDVTDYCAEGYTCEQNADGTYGVVEAATELFTLAGVTTSLDSSLALNIYYTPADGATATDYYAVVAHQKDGTVAEMTIPYADWGTSGSRKLIRYTGLAAKEMADELTFTIYDAKGNAVSKSFTTSFRAYAIGMMSSGQYDPTEHRVWFTALTDMLNYGAAAQQMFGYKTDNLANAGADDFQQYASTEYTLSTDGFSMSGTAWAPSLTLENTILLNFYFNDVTEGMYATYSYTTHAGTPVSATVDYDSFVSGWGHFGVAVPIAIADAGTPVTVTMFNADGSVAGTMTCSANNYLKGMIENDPDVALYPALAMFAASAKAAFAD